MKFLNIWLDFREKLVYCVVAHRKTGSRKGGDYMTDTKLNMPQTASLEPEKLLETLMIARVDYIHLAGKDEEERVVSLLDQALPIITKAWGLPQEHLDETQKIVRTERENIQRGAETGEYAPCSLPKEKVLQGMYGDEILQVIWSLFETTARTNDAEERDHLVKTAHFLSEYWDLQEWVKR